MNLLIRADAGPAIGTGHVMRCIALAQEWIRAGGAVTLMTAEGAPAIVERSAAEGLQVIETPPRPPQEDAEATGREASRQGAEWVVVDGYHFSGGFTDAIRRTGHRVLQLDDYGHSGRVTADLMLNQNLYAEASQYPEREAHARLLLGPSYVLLRREFWPMRGQVRAAAERGHRILVTLGGSDPENVTARIVRALTGLANRALDVLVLVGGANPHVEGLRQIASQDSRFRIEVNAIRMPELMSWADVAVLSGGTTCWEATFAGLPFVVLVCADHQYDVARALDEAGVARSMGWYADVTDDAVAGAVADLLEDREQRVTRAARGQQLIDGYGVERVRAAMMNA